MVKGAEEVLIFLFDEILPRQGMSLRVRQKELSLEMLRALQEDKLALCETEVRTGKTNAYRSWREKSACLLHFLQDEISADYQKFGNISCGYRRGDE